MSEALNNNFEQEIDAGAKVREVYEKEKNTKDGETEQEKTERLSSELNTLFDDALSNFDQRKEFATVSEDGKVVRFVYKYKQNFFNDMNMLKDLLIDGVLNGKVGAIPLIGPSDEIKQIQEEGLKKVADEIFSIRFAQYPSNMTIGSVGMIIDYKNHSGEVKQMIYPLARGGDVMEYYEEISRGEQK